MVNYTEICILLERMRMGDHSESNVIGNVSSTQEIPLFTRYIHKPKHSKRGRVLEWIKNYLKS